MEIESIVHTFCENFKGYFKAFLFMCVLSKVEKSLPEFFYIRRNLIGFFVCSIETQSIAKCQNGVNSHRMAKTKCTKRADAFSDNVSSGRNLGRTECDRFRP